MLKAEIAMGIHDSNAILTNYDDGEFNPYLLEEKELIFHLSLGIKFVKF